MPAWQIHHAEKEAFHCRTLGQLAVRAVAGREETGAHCARERAAIDRSTRRARLAQGLRPGRPDQPVALKKQGRQHGTVKSGVQRCDVRRRTGHNNLLGTVESGKVIVGKFTHSHGYDSE